VGVIWAPNAIGAPFFRGDMRENPDKTSKQVPYLGRWVDKEFFRAFVYKPDGSQKLARNYDEFKELIATGLWFDSKESFPKLEQEFKGKKKNGISSPIG
jgi:hypothetical protein